VIAPSSSEDRPAGTAGQSVEYVYTWPGPHIHAHHHGGVSIRLPTRCLVLLVGPSGAGKSTWAEAEFRPEQIVSSDGLRALVGEGPYDQRAGKDAFDVLDLVLERRLRRGLFTVADTLGLDPTRRAAYRDLAARHRVPCHAVRFDTAAAACRQRNRGRATPVPAKVLTAQLASYEVARAALEVEGYAAVHDAGPVTVVPPALLDAPAAAARQKEDPMPLRFGLQISRYDWASDIGVGLTAVAQAAEAAGFASLWVMDHMLQIPQVGREWDPMLDAYTALGFLAAATTRCRVGALVSPVTYRTPAHLAKIVASLDVLSGGRAICGLGAGWFEREHRVYGFDFPPRGERLDRLADVLELLPLMWGPGAPSYTGRRVSVPEAICYPRPVQSRIPLLVGGQGERRTLRLVAQYADACNLFGPAEVVRHKLSVLAAHCAAVDRPLAEIEVTHLSTVLCASDPAAAVETYRPRGSTPEAYTEAVLAGTVEDHVGRFRELAEAGIHTAIVSLADLGPESVAAFAPVIAAFPRRVPANGAHRP